MPLRVGSSIPSLRTGRTPSKERRERRMRNPNIVFETLSEKSNYLIDWVNGE